MTKFRWMILAALASVALLMACNRAETPTAEPPTVEPATTETAVAVVTVVVTPTPQPEAVSATPTASPTLAPATPTASPIPQQPPEAVRISFEAGATAATVQGSLTAGGRGRYVLRAFQGQQLVTNLRSGSGDVTLVVTDPSGSPLANPANTVLTTTGDYVFDLTGGASDTTYSMTVGVVGAAPPPPAPTATATAAAPPPSGQPIRITFAPGATSASVNGTVAMNGTVRYVLRAAQGQQMTLTLTAPPAEVGLRVSGPTGLLKEVDASPTFGTILPATGDYFVDVVSLLGAFDKAYTLTVSIVTPPQPQPPQRISFAPGATSATVNGTINAGGVVDYVLRAAAGQTMTVNIISPNGDVLLTVVSPSGIPLKRSADDSPFWTGTLPEDGDYNLKAVSVGAATTYTLEVSVVSGSQPPQPAEPVRISFAPGATSATVSGVVAMNGTAAYVLRAAQGQTMSITVAGPQDEIALRVTGPTGLLKDDLALTWSGVLPATGDYYIDLVSVLGAFDKPFTLTVSVVN